VFLLAAAELSYASVSNTLTRSLSEAFGPGVVVETKKAPGDQAGEKVFVLVVSSRFNGKTPRQRQAAVWRVIRQSLGKDREGRVALAMVRGTDDVW
jgi:stress-induced morphogen